MLLVSFMVRLSLVQWGVGLKPFGPLLLSCRLLWTLKPLPLALLPSPSSLCDPFICRVRSVLQDIKDLMRKAGEVTFADINKDQDNQG